MMAIMHSARIPMQPERSENFDKVSQAWNTIYNVLHLNRISFDPEDAAKCIRQPLIAILEAIHDDWPNTMDYLSRNEVLFFLAQKSKEAANEAAIIAFFTYLVEAIPKEGLLDSACIDAVTLTLHNSTDSRGLLLSLLKQMNKFDALLEGYLCEAVVRGALKPVLQDGDVSLLCLLCNCITDFELHDLGVYCKALAIQMVNAVMFDDVEVIQRIDFLLENAKWEQLRVCFVESIRLYCVNVLADSDANYLAKFLSSVCQPELVIPICTRLLPIALNQSPVAFDFLKMIADKAPGLVFLQSKSDREHLKQFPIDKNELIAAIDKHSNGQSMYQEYVKELGGQGKQVPVFIASLRRVASQCKVEEGSSLEQLLLMAEPIPVCMPATARLCAYYLAFLQSCELNDD